MLKSNFGLYFSSLAALVAILASPLHTAKAQDFANLGRYSAANEELLRRGNPIDVLIIGDSITARWPRARPHFFEETGWVARGITSETTPQVLLRFQQDVIDLAPNYVVILAGTNDVAGNSGEMNDDDTIYYLRSMVEIARAKGIKPVLCKVLPAADFPWAPGRRPAERIPELNQRIEALALAENVPLVNFFSVMNDGSNGMRGSFSDDGVHPNALGYSAMESRLKAQMGMIMSSGG